MISVIIPSFGRTHLLGEVLLELNNQAFNDFECIVVDDGNPNSVEETLRDYEFAYPIEFLRQANFGPAVARNAGARIARGDILLFLGADCFSDRDLIAQHYYSHQFDGSDIVQGYTKWSPAVITPFYDFLNDSGLQAAWGNLKDGETWKHEISPSFCLTTNYSIRRQLFLNEQFNEVFDSVNWEDVEFGYRLAKYGDAIRATVNPRAINYHYHRYDLDGFLRRSFAEGRNRITLCKLHPEMAWNMLNPFELRAVKDLDLSDITRWAKELDLVRLDRDNEQTQKLKEIKYQKYAEVCRIYSYLGVLDRIKDEHPAMQAIQHVHQPMQLIQILTGVAAMENGNLGYASHTAEWFSTEREDDWSAHAYVGEVELACGNREEAIAAFRRSIAINSGAKWPKWRISELI